MPVSSFSPSRRQLLAGTAASAIVMSAGRAFAAPSVAATTPLPLNKVRLLDSPYKTAVDANHAYLLRLSPDRFLHNYHKFAGLPVRGAVYGGWEGDTIAGEGLGHYLSALALTYQQTGDTECVRRIDYITAEMARVQAAQGDGYCAGFLRKRKDGTIVDGKEIFAEIKAGDIRSYGFDLNGAWSPLYNLHKVFAGLLDAHAMAGSTRALEVAKAFGGYMDGVFGALSDEQVQQVLNCEYGGINESFAELYARTGDRRWLKLSERIYDKKVLDAVVAGRDELSNIHSNTQIPKIIGLARISELDDRPEFAKGAGFFWERVTGHHSFVIGGNGDREYFFEPDTISQHVTEQTCEHCASYNMLKLTRQLYSWKPEARYFDYYERTHLNHVLAAQNPKTGMFTYMTPLMSGSARGFSSPEDDFWCCVLSGMESHSKHGESIYWQGRDAKGDVLYVNLYIPSVGMWDKRRATFELTTRYPYGGHIALKLKQYAGGAAPFTVALRIPGWAKSAAAQVNGQAVPAQADGGYVRIRRAWRAGDVVTLDLPLDLRFESPADNPKLVTLLRGPMVMAADLGTVETEFTGDAPALVGADLLAGFKPVKVDDAVYRTAGIGRPGDMDFTPFYAQYERRSAVYFQRYTDDEWATAQVAYRAEQARQRDEAARSVDVMHLGEMQAEHDHNLQSDISWPVVYRARNGRDARNGGYFSFDFKVTRDGKDAGPLILQATYWGSENNRIFDIMVDGTVIATERLSGRQPGAWIDVDYPVPEALTKAKQKVTVRFQPKEGKSAGPVFGVKLFTATAASSKA